MFAVDGVAGVDPAAVACAPPPPVDCGIDGAARCVDLSLLHAVTTTIVRLNPRATKVVHPSPFCFDRMLVARGLTKEYQSGTQKLVVLNDVSFEVSQGSFISIVGPSGSGKTTLLGLLAGLDTPSRGTVTLDGTDIGTLNEDQRAQLRGLKVGFVFQSFQLIPTLAKEIGDENLFADILKLASEIASRSAKHSTDFLNKTPKVAESLMMSLNRERGCTIVLVTHDATLAARTQRTIRLRDGVIVEDVMHPEFDVARAAMSSNPAVAIR